MIKGEAMKIKYKSSILILYFFLFIIFSACQKQEVGWKGEIKTVDGVKVVHNFEPVPEESFKPIEFLVDLSIGVEEGDENYMFNYPVDIDSDSEGNIYVLDYQDRNIRKFDPRGKFVTLFGRTGQGLGEFERPYSMVIDHQNNFHVGDYLARKIEVFSQAGIYQKTLSLDFLYFFSVNKNNELIIGHDVYDEDGNRFYNVGRFDFQKKEVEDFFSQIQYCPARIMKGEFVYEFPYYVRWDINSKDHIYVASGVAYEISVISPEGNLLFKFTKDLNPVKVKGEEMNMISDMLQKRGPNPFMPNLVYPVFRYIAIDEKDRVWVEHYQPTWRNRFNTETRYDVFSSEGKFLFSAKINRHISRHLIFKNGFIYALAADESGFIKALRLRMIEN